MLKLQFVDVESDRAKMLLNELRNDLVKRGIGPERISFPPGDKSYMGVGDILQITQGVPYAVVNILIAVILFVVLGQPSRSAT